MWIWNLHRNFMKHPLTKLTIILTFISLSAKAETIDCLAVREGNKYLIIEGKNCDVMYSPASTFKIPLAVIGFESGILKDENRPVWHSKKPVDFLFDYWSGDKTPLTWMKYSIVWYSQELTSKLGQKTFQKYVNLLNYGNKDLSGNEGQNDGLTQAWLSSSLKISSLEQLDFIEKLAQEKLDISKESQKKTRNLIHLFEESLLTNGWILYGKTGTDVDRKTSERRGYFVGFATKQKRLVSFVIHISGEIDSKVGGIFAKRDFINNKRVKKLFEE